MANPFQSLSKGIAVVCLLLMVFTIHAWAAPGSPDKVIVSVNRYAVWAPYENDFGVNGSTFTVYALVMNSTGMPVPDENVTFKIYSASGLVSTQQAATAANGLAHVSYDVSSNITSGSDPNSGQWHVDAYPTSYTGVNGTTKAWYSANPGCYNALCHKTRDYSGNYPLSPYNDMFGLTQTRSARAHETGMHDTRSCTNCHVGYDSETGTRKPVGTHSAMYCTECHTGIGTNGSLDTSAAGTSGGIPAMKSCYDCHPNHNDKLTNISTLGTVGGIPDVSIYSWNFSAPEVAHTASGSSLTQGIPCILCHGPMHNISKPVMSNTSNNYTEDTQCTSCHVNQGKHSTSNPVYCTACHSQDVHNIGVLNKTASSQPTYTSLGSANAMTKNDCTKCHESGPEADFFGNLTNMTGYGYTKNYTPATPEHYNHNGSVSCTVCHNNTDFHHIKFLTKTGSDSTNTTDVIDCTDCHYSNNTAVRNVVKTRYGSYPPTIPELNHSTDNGGQKWGSYWTTDLQACLYCHGDTKHNSNALGNIHTALSNDTVGGIIDNGTVCASCHVPDDPDYSATTALLSPVPPANQGTGLPTGGFNHSRYGDTDSICLICHGDLNPANMSEFPHMVDNQTWQKCTKCHFSWKKMNMLNVPSKYVNETMFDQSAHVTLSCKNCHTNTTRHPPPESGRKACEDCHSVQQDPKNQTDRHDITRDPWNYSIPGVSGSVVNITDCTTCHNATLYNNAISTYGYNKTHDCDYCHTYPDKTYNSW